MLMPSRNKTRAEPSRRERLRKRLRTKARLGIARDLGKILSARA